MKKLIVVFIVLLLAVWLGVLMRQQSGYVLISMGHWRIETSLWLVLLALVLLFFALYWLWRFITGAYHIPQRYERWQQNKALQLMERGISALLEGQWKQAETNFVKAAKLGKLKFVNYLGAAKAAQEEKNVARRDAYLQKAKEKMTDEQVIPLGIVQASWQLENEQWQSALQTLLQINVLAPKNPLILLGMKRAYVALQQWDALKNLLPKLQKAQMLDGTKFLELQLQIYGVLLEQSAESQHYSALEKQWDAIPKALQEQPQLVSVYVRYLLQLKQTEKAEQVLKMQLRKTKDARLLELYAQLVSADSAKQLHRAEGWLTSEPNNPALLFCLGQLCARHRLWGKARSYFEAALKIEPQPAIYLAQGKVLEELGDQAAALKSYRNGLGTRYGNLKLLDDTP
jgi:HemY protein